LDGVKENLDRELYGDAWEHAHENDASQHRGSADIAPVWKIKKSNGFAIEQTRFALGQVSYSQTG
jgi:hypothetical protein